MKVWLVYYASPMEHEPDEPALEGIYFNEAAARESIGRSRYSYVEERETNDEPDDA